MSNKSVTAWLIAFGWAAFISCEVQADAFVWIALPGVGEWSTAGNWAPAGGPPMAGDTATFNASGSYTARIATGIFGGGNSADALNIFSGTVTLESSSTTFLGLLNLTTGAADLSVINTANLFIGSTNRALAVNVGDLLEVTDGADVEVRSGADLSANQMEIGRGPSTFDFSSVTITGSGSTLTTTSPTVYSHLGGNGRSGSLTVENSATATLGPTQISQGGMFVLSNGDATISRLVVGPVTSSGTPGTADLFVSDNGSTLTLNGLEVYGAGSVEVDDLAVITSNSFGTTVSGGAIYVGPNGTFHANAGLLASDGGTVHVTGGTFNLNAVANLFSGGTIEVLGGTFNATADVNVQIGGVVNIDGGTFSSNQDANVSGGGKVFVRSGRFDVVQLVVDGAGSRFTLDGGELETAAITLLNGGQLDWKSGALTLTNGVFAVPASVPFGGTLNTARDGAVTMNGPFFQSPDSTINAQGATTLGSAPAANGFASQGNLIVGNHTVTLQDANDAVFDATALVTLGSGSNPGTLQAANGLTLNFGGNITGFGTVNTPDDPFEPLINNGHIVGNSAVQPITLTGYVKGVGTLDDVVITGTDAPGFSPATVYRGSVDYEGTLVIELAGDSAGTFDVIHHSGLATLGGTLEVSLLSGFTPSPGDLFEIITAAGGVSGQFDTLANELPTLSSGLAWAINYGSNNVVLQVVAAGIPGDYNNDGAVDSADFVAWQKGGLVPSTPENYNLWRTNFGQTNSGATALGATGSASASEAGATVPEPSVIALLLLIMAGVSIARRREASADTKLVCLKMREVSTVFSG